MFRDGLAKPRELWSVALVAVGVALISTVAGAWLDRVHQVDAEGLAVHEETAVARGDVQSLKLAQWGVAAEMPLAAEMPAVRYTMDGLSSVGLSTADLEQVGPACRASRNGLGAVLRVPAGTYDEFAKGSGRHQYIKTLGEYDFAYQSPDSACLNDSQAASIINREMSVLREALSTLTPSAN